MQSKIKYIIIFLGFINLCVHGQKPVNTFDENGKTLLINAISKKDFAKAKQLIEKGANVNLQEQKGLHGTPLMYATHTGNEELCKLLIEKGANVNAIDVNKDPALNWATYYGQIAVMNFLIENGADIHLKSKHGTAVDVALRLWHQDSVANVFRPFYKNDKALTKKEQRIIKYAIDGDFDKLIKTWSNKISPNLKDNLGIPLLQFTTQANNKKATEFLINKGASINVLNRVGQTPLTWASRFGYIDMVKLLLKAGADPNKFDERYQLSSLIGATVSGNTEIGKLLLTHGADINHKEIVNDATALVWAIFRGNTEFAKMLATHGANYHEKIMNKTMSAYDMAVAYKNKDLQVFFDAKDQEEKQKGLLGSWKIKEIHYLYPDTTYVRKELDYGRLIVSKRHYAIQYQPMMMKRTPFKNLSKGEDVEIKKAFQTIVFNSGSYVIEDDVIHTTVDIAKVPGFEGGQQYYRFKLNGDNLIMTLFDETYPNGKKPEWYGKIKVKFILGKEE